METKESTLRVLPQVEMLDQNAIVEEEAAESDVVFSDNAGGGLKVEGVPNEESDASFLESPSREESKMGNNNRNLISEGEGEEGGSLAPSPMRDEEKE